MKSRFVGCLLLLSSAQIHASTAVYFDGISPAGGDRLWGVGSTFSDSNGDDIQVFDAPNDSSLRIIINNEYADIELSTPGSTNFSPGTYARAVRMGGGVNGLPEPGVDSAIAGQGCNETYGWIKSYEFAVDGSGNIQKLAVDYIQHCEGAPAVLFGAIRVNSDIPTTRTQPYAVAGRTGVADQGEAVTLDGSDSLSFSTPTLSYHWAQTGGPSVTLMNSNSARPTFVAPDVPPGGQTLTFMLTVSDGQGSDHQDTDSVSVIVHNPADPQTRAFFDSPPGEPLFEGLRDYYSNESTGSNAVTFEFNNLDWTFSATTIGTDNLGISFTGAYPFNHNAPSASMTFSSQLIANFANKHGVQIVSGAYKDAQSMDPNTSLFPYSSISGNGVGCTDIGQFQILELDTSPKQDGTIYGTVNKLAVDFQESCVSADLPDGVFPPIKGSIRINSSVALHDGLIPAPPNPLPASVSLTVSPTQIEVNQPATLTWKSTNADYCYGTNGFDIFTFLAPSGSMTVTNPAAGAQNAIPFEIDCYSSNSFAYATATLTAGSSSSSSSGSPAATGGGAFGFETLLGLGLAWVRRRSNSQSS